MRKFLAFLFVFIFLLTTTRLRNSVDRNIKTDKTKEFLREKLIPKTMRDTLAWRTAKASYYDSQDPTQTKDDCNGVGAFGREIKSGSIAFGSSITDNFRENGVEVFIQIKDFDVVTPYGKGIFRVDDVMAERFNKEGRYFIDFFHEDLNSHYKRLGRFYIKFRIFKIVKPEVAISQLLVFCF